MLLQQTQFTLLGCTFKLCIKGTFLPSFVAVSKHYHLAKLIFCLCLLFSSRIPSKTATLWSCLSSKYKKKPKAQVLRYKVSQNVLFLFSWCSHTDRFTVFPQYFIILLDCFIMAQMLSFSHTRLPCYRQSGYWMSSMKNNLVNACLLKDVSLQIHLVSGSQLHINVLIFSSPSLDWWWVFCFGVKCFTKDLLSWQNFFHIKTVLQKFYRNDHHLSFYKPYSCHFCSFPWTLQSIKFWLKWKYRSKKRSTYAGEMMWIYLFWGIIGLGDVQAHSSRSVKTLGEHYSICIPKHKGGK